MSIPTTSSRVSGRGFLRPTVGDIHYFAAISDYPCISILLPTRPQSRMAVDDQARLEGLVRVARSELQAEGIAVGEQLVDEIAQLARHLTELPTDQGLVIYASRGMLEYRHLPVPVVERVIIDPTFATRDLVASRPGQSCISARRDRCGGCPSLRKQDGLFGRGHVWRLPGGSGRWPTASRSRIKAWTTTRDKAGKA